MTTIVVSCYDPKGIYNTNMNSEVTIINGNNIPLLSYCTTTLVGTIPDDKLAKINSTNDGWDFIDKQEYYDAEKLKWIKEVRNNILSSLDWLDGRYNRKEFLIAEGENITNWTVTEFKSFLLFKESLASMTDSIDVNNIIWPVPPTFINQYLIKFEPYFDLA